MGKPKNEAMDGIDNDWISRRWQGEGNVVLSEPVGPKPDPTKQNAKLTDGDLAGNVGRHCACSDCRVLDFLPVQCTECNKFYCPQHSTFEAHGCERPGKTAPSCPLCTRAIHVRKEEGESLDQAMDRHIESGCKS